MVTSGGREAVKCDHAFDFPAGSCCGVCDRCGMLALCPIHLAEEIPPFVFGAIEEE
jgi:hypothetical protein